MNGKMPSQTIRPARSSLNPRWTNVFRKLPACDVPLASECLTHPGHRIRRPAPVSARVSEERHEIARRRKADAQDERILRRVDQLVQPGRIEPVFQADA